MPFWEYDKIDLNEVSQQGDDIDLLNAAGAGEWELVAVSAKGIAYLKRRAKSASSDPAG